MTHDIFGQQTSLTQTASVEAWNATLMGFLAHAAVTPQHLAQVLEAEPGFALGHAVKGMFYLLLGRREMYVIADEALAAAQAACRDGDVTLRERLFVEALEVWIAGRPSQAIDKLETVLRAHPEDALAMKLSHAVRFVLGDAVGMRQSVERVMPAYGPDHAGRGYLLGCHAFALEETGEYDRAETTGRQALWMAPDDAGGCMRWRMCMT